jgi:hypothetical protein
MSVYVDGERSRQRLGFAKSLLNKLKMLGQRSKHLIYEGFLYRVSVTAPGLDKIAVTAPVGAFFICMTKNDARVMKSDYYLGLVEPSRPYHTVTGSIDPGFVGEGGYYVWEEAQKSLCQISAVGTPPSPVATVAAGELYGVWCAYQSSTNYPSRVRFDVGLYSGNGSQSLTYGYAFTHSTGRALFCQPQPSNPWWFASVQHSGPGDRIYVDQQLNTPIAYSLASRFSTLGFGVGVPAQYAYYSIPPTLKSILTSLSTCTYFHTVGGYGFSPGLTALPTVVQILDCTSSDLDSYFVANPSHETWRMVCSIQNLDEGWVLNFPLVDMLDSVYNFSGIKGGEDNAFQASYTPVLYGPIPAKVEAMTLWRTAGKGDGVYDPVYEPVYDSGDPPAIIRYDRVRWDVSVVRLKKAARQLMPWPNSSDYAPIDSAMFHTHDDKVFIVTKRYPVIVIDTTTGLYRSTATMPAASAPSGIRPEIFHAGSGVYYCISRNVAAGTIVGVHVGSPYTGWVDLPLPADTLVQVRALECTATRQVLMGVTYNAGYKYHVLFREDGVGSWRYIAKLDITTPPADCSWSMSVYGDSQLVVQMKALASQPPATQSYRYTPVEEQP